MKLELDHQERLAIRKSLSERKARLIETVQDTTQHPTARLARSRELAAIASVLRKLRALGEAE